MTAFTDLGLNAPLLQALADENYLTPTPIQAKAIPGVLEGRDLLGIAQTGTGKTAAFALPILHRLAANPRPAMRKGCRVLILSPTRELATQIAESFRTYGRHLGISVAVVFGGVGHRPQIQALARGVDVLVATPGRLLDHMGERDIDIQGAEIFVLDEADQMLDLGFVKPIRQIVRQLSQRRQSLFFSATMPAEIGRLADELLNNPLRVSVAPTATTVERVTQRVIHCDHSRKRSLLVELLADDVMQRTLVFTRTKRGADRVASHLEGAKIAVAAIHGNKSQRQREEALEAFKDGEIRVLVATDIAARGIDVDSVTHVVNYEMPDVPESYVHRIGRTARAGALGIAISLVDGEERPQLRDIERLTRQQIPSEDRRGDQTLVVTASTPRSADRGRSASQRPGGQRPGAQRPSGQRSGGPRQGRERDRRDQGSNGGGRPQEAGGARSQDVNSRSRTQDVNGGGRSKAGASRTGEGAHPPRSRPAADRGGDRPQHGGPHRSGERSGGRPQRSRPGSDRRSHNA